MINTEQKIQRQKKQRQKKIIENVVIPIVAIGGFIGYGCIVIFANTKVFFAFTIVILVIAMALLITKKSKK